MLRTSAKAIVLLLLVIIGQSHSSPPPAPDVPAARLAETCATAASGSFPERMQERRGSSRSFWRSESSPMPGRGRRRRLGFRDFAAGN
ncbi:Os07g0136775 [Oryza sativa Japonica Group]|uniref:Os07g0136775 protein n=1 Tax=Oryza sativa subsp. japonica TaxID=39947 RepID=A0A0P0X273_ORYSJ|nr:Os07g0136775 [Oryza sativa Japonica Group]